MEEGDFEDYIHWDAMGQPGQYKQKHNNMQPTLKQYILSAIGIIVLLTILMIGCPAYGVYTASQHGKAQLAKATYSRQIAVAEAKAKMESAELLAQADTIRAHGIARSNQIIGSSLSDQYLHWFWINELQTTKDKVIYIPTEAGMPILEAGKREIPITQNAK